MHYSFASFTPIPRSSLLTVPPICGPRSSCLLLIGHVKNNIDWLADQASRRFSDAPVWGLSVFIIILSQAPTSGKYQGLIHFDDRVAIDAQEVGYCAIPAD